MESRQQLKQWKLQLSLANKSDHDAADINVVNRLLSHGLETLDKIDSLNKLSVDADRYIWLLTHMGLVETYAESWKPGIHKPLMSYLQDFIDTELPKAGASWVVKQRELLNRQR